MSLSDPRYIFFLFLVFLLFNALRPGAPRRLLLLAASYYFYFKLSQFYILILLFVTVVTYFGAKFIRSSQAHKQSFLLFVAILLITIFPLIIFKYLGVFLTDSIRENFMLLAFPIGISFFTFVALGYLIDVYLEVVDPEPSFPRVALLLAFFPLISAGPIERSGRFLPQFDLETKFSSERALLALRLIFIGLAFKLIFAENLQKPVDAVFAAPGNFGPIEQLLGVVYYAFSLYSDFAGYSLIAIGSAKLMGLEVRPNFQQPFFSTSIPEFWRNWHISLSSWVRDYIFMPLRTQWRDYRNGGQAAAALLAFTIIGVWHGAKWGYFVFGLMHGSLAVVSMLTLARRDAFWKSVNMPPLLLHIQRALFTFCLVLVTFVVFRAQTLTDAMTLYRGIFSMGMVHDIVQGSGYAFFHQGQPLTFQLVNHSARLGLIALLLIGDFLVSNKITLETMPRIVQGIVYAVGITIFLYDWITENVAAPFQYYKF